MGGRAAGEAALSSETAPASGRRRLKAQDRWAQLATGRAAAALLWVVPVLFFTWFSAVDRWTEADAALAQLGSGPRIVVGMSTQRGTGDSHVETHSRMFLVLPASLRTLQSYSVTQEKGKPAHVQPVRFGLLIFGGFYAVWIGGSLWYLTRRLT